MILLWSGTPVFASTEVYGLNEEGRSGWAAVLDLDEMQARWIEP